MVKGRRASQSRGRHSQRSHYGRRAVHTRAPLAIVIVICDDSSTAPAYFNLLKREVKQHVTVTIIPASRQGGSPRTVVDRAIAEHGKLKVDRDARDAVWAVFDLEGDANCRMQAQEARQHAENRGVKVALSDPCYEVWTLLHLEDTGRDFPGCAHVKARIGQLWKSQFDQPFERKAQADYSKIIDSRHEAAARARRHREANDPSWTEVYKIIEHIEEQVTQSKDS